MSFVTLHLLHLFPLIVATLRNCAFFFRWPRNVLFLTCQYYDFLVVRQINYWSRNANNGRYIIGRFQNAQLKYIVLAVRFAIKVEKHFWFAYFLLLGRSCQFMTGSIQKISSAKIFSSIYITLFTLFCSSLINS